MFKTYLQNYFNDIILKKCITKPFDPIASSKTKKFKFKNLE